MPRAEPAAEYVHVDTLTPWSRNPRLNDGEPTGRRARLIELDPGYCDVIRRRWTRWARANGRDAGSGALDG